MREKLLQKIEKYKQIIKLLLLVRKLEKEVEIEKCKTNMSEVIYRVAHSLIGKKVRTVSRELACAECVNIIVEKATGKPAGGTTSTYRMYNALGKNWLEVQNPVKGDIIISPTGLKTGSSNISNGHVGIVGDNQMIYSNNSETGLLDDNWNIPNWKNYYGKRGKYMVKYFRYPQPKT